MTSDSTPAPALGAQQLESALAELRAAVEAMRACGPFAVSRLLAAYDAAVAERDAHAPVVRAARALEAIGYAHSPTTGAQYVSVRAEDWNRLRTAVAALPLEDNHA